MWSDRIVKNREQRAERGEREGRDGARKPVTGFFILFIKYVIN
jgi:hypothetical protein